MFLLKKKYHQLSDEQLMPFIADGQEKAFNVLYGRYAQKMQRYFYRMLYQNSQLAEDFVQELFIKVIDKAHSFDPEKKCATWLYAIAVNLCKNEYRRNERYQNRLQHIAAPVDPVSIDEQLDQQQRNQVLQKAIEGLEEAHRQCYILRYQEEHSIKEIAQILDCPEGTVKSRIYYAVKKLADKLQYLHSKSSL